MKRTSDLHIQSIMPLVAPRALKEAYPITEKAAKTVLKSREIIGNIISGTDKRMLAIAGPCSIHDVKAGLEYAERLNSLREKLKDRIFTVMRVYFEKPRTRLGWRGMILDPDLDDSYDIGEGLKRARKFLLTLGEMGMAAGSEMLDPIVPQYLDDLTSWAAIGARTTESQTHREMASGLSMPVGFKNATDGSVDIALNAMTSARQSHGFIGIDQEGRTCVLSTTGNPQGHIILRGGRSGPNYYEECVEDTVKLLRKAELPEAVVIDCSHANSRKDYSRQERVLDAVIRQRTEGNGAMVGFMLESFLFEGNQPIPEKPSGLKYGVSVTDPCISFETTERIMRKAYSALGSVL
jgi:3-deoxy-7-phosphoheptulonate synthase